MILPLEHLTLGHSEVVEVVHLTQISSALKAGEDRPFNSTTKTL